MNDIKLPPIPLAIDGRLNEFAEACVRNDHEGRVDSTRQLRKAIDEHAREAVRLNATVPDGWKLVPVEPTPEMIDAANFARKYREHGALTDPDVLNSRTYNSRQTYAAMLSAAPAAPQPAQQPLTDEQIKRIMLDNGFTIKEGLTDLKPYVYAAARALIAAATGVKP